MSLDIAGLKPITVPFSNLTLSGGGFTNARKTRSDITELKNSILSQGLIYDLVVWLRSEDEDTEAEYIIIDGAGRYTAISQILEEYDGADEYFGEMEVRAYEGDLAGAQAINLITGTMQELLNPVDEADACAALVSRLGSQAPVAELLNRSPAWVSNRCALSVGLCERAKEELRGKRIRLKSARRLAEYVLPDGRPDEEKQNELLDKLLGDKEPIPKPAESTRRRTIRSKADVEELRASLIDLDVPGVDGDHINSIRQVVRWYFMELSTEDVFNREVAVEEGAVPAEEGDSGEDYKERVRT